jgi:hypothetical protein
LVNWTTVYQQVFDGHSKKVIEWKQVSYKYTRTHAYASRE